MDFQNFFNTSSDVDPTKKRGPHHLNLGRGLNTKRKNPGIVARMNQIDSSEHPLIRRLKGIASGKEFIHNPSDAQKIASKYGISLSKVQQGKPRTLGNKTGITIQFDPSSKKYVLTK
jgi:hypothetical protein